MQPEEPEARPEVYEEPVPPVHRPVVQEIPREEPSKKKQPAASQRKTFGLGTWTKIKNKIGNAIDDFYTNLTKEVEIKE